MATLGHLLVCQKPSLRKGVMPWFFPCVACRFERLCCCCCRTLILTFMLAFSNMITFSVHHCSVVYCGLCVCWLISVLHLHLFCELRLLLKLTLSCYIAIVLFHIWLFVLHIYSHKWSYVLTYLHPWQFLKNNIGQNHQIIPIIVSIPITAHPITFYSLHLKQKHILKTHYCLNSVLCYCID